MTTATLTLAEFLSARYAEDEAQIREAQELGYSFTISPAQMLADCEAKRRIVALHAGHHECPRDAEPENDIAGLFGDDDSCPTLRALALPFADHPDYRPEWRP